MKHRTADILRYAACVALPATLLTACTPTPPPSPTPTEEAVSTIGDTNQQMKFEIEKLNINVDREIARQDAQGK